MKNDCKIDYHLAKRGCKNSFAEDDVLGLLPDIDEVVSITSYTVNGKSQDKEVSCKPLQDFCEAYNTHPILFVSGVSISEYPEEPTKDEMGRILEEQEKFLLENNFTSINDYVGYETRRAYIYNNGIGKQLLETISKLQ